MRIAMLSPVVGDAFGQERVMRESTRLLREAGHQVIYVADRVVGKLPPVDGLELIEGLSSIHLLSSPLSAFRLQQSALRRIASFKPDIVHLIDQFDWRFQKQLVDRFNVVYTSHLVASTCPSSTRLIRGNSLCLEKSSFKCVLHHQKYGCLSRFKSVVHRGAAVQDYLLRKWSLGEARATIAVSQYVRQVLLHDGWHPERVHLVYNPVWVNPLREKREKVPGQILCVSRLEEYKGIQILLRSLKRLEKNRWTLLLCGEGAYRSELENLVAVLNLRERVKFIGRTSFEQTAVLMAESDLVVQPNVGPEPFGLGIAEASLLGVAVVASDLPALNEIIEPGVNGLLFKASDEADLADKISNVLSDDSLREGLAEAGPQRMTQIFSPERHLAGTLAVYHLSLGRQAPVDTSPPRGSKVSPSPVRISPIPLTE